jgi:membrane protein implicated in regulation of membrane protease activity
MSLWFWAWVIVAVVIAATSALARDRFAASFMLGASAAAALEAAHVGPAAQWIAFIVLSGVVLVIADRPRSDYTPRHRRSALGRHSRGSASERG